MARPTAAEQSSPRIIVYALVGVALFVGLYFHAYALPQLSPFAGGLSMPDARIIGFDTEDITALRQALEYEAAGQLNFLHKTAGIIFPITVLLATWATFGLLARGSWRWLMVAGAGLFAVVEIAKGFLIDHVLVQDPLQSATVTAASTMTILSWVLLIAIGGSVTTFLVRDVVITRDPPPEKSA